MLFRRFLGPPTLVLDDPSRLDWERRVLVAARAGDRSACEALYRTFAGLLFAQVLMPRLGGDRALSEDALAETFRTVFDSLGSVEVRDRSLWFWLRQVAVSRAEDLRRKQSSRARTLVSYAELMPHAESTAPDARLDLAELEDQVAIVLDQINPRYRGAIELRFLNDKSRDACASQLEVSVATFDVLLLRALRAFRAAWEQRNLESL